ncbi:E3 ubiquitin-protein ligase TRIM39-like [Cololabis saira]|uniref:E3 ubiquitin-protein ligase TRIM39-like n=1 Tax=Cololabis saira TaxID=129043 RepID=UPI002AD22300|nr:E3 ubiquitin-protein ligase TRIM39-like [Cololabis saira]
MTPQAGMASAAASSSEPCSSKSWSPARNLTAQAGMACAVASPSEPCSLEKHLSCSICMETFTDPVTTACGHSFCRSCLGRHFHYVTDVCPLCKKYVNTQPEVNIVLRDIAEQMKNTLRHKYSGAPGEVACDVCTEPKMKAEKSCLMCVASYCPSHVKNHYSSKRLKGHRLVEPVENLDARACLTHGRAFELYSRKQQMCICVQCMEEGQQEVVPTEDEWDKKKAQLENSKRELKQEIKKRETKVEEISEALKSCKKELENEWWDIDAVFTAVNAILELAQAALHQPLEERRQLLEKEAKDLKDELEAEIDKLQRTISELEDISALEDHILFLQKYPSLVVQTDFKDWTKVELDTSLSFGTMRSNTLRMMEKVQEELETLTSTELKRLSQFTVDVKLDPSTAHQRLVVSEDGKEVKDGGEDQEVADAPDRFDLFGSVLGLNCFTSGRSYWEVEVNEKTGWDLGVATGAANRKGKLTLTPDKGYWVLVHYEEENYAAMTAPPVRLSLKEKPGKVGVFVDYDEGLVSFYDVPARSHIYSFTKCLFRDELYPYFSPHIKQDEKNSDPLVIFTEKSSEMELDEEWRRLSSISI